MSKTVSLNAFGNGNNISLNYNIVNSVNEPINPVENTIWVNTDKVILHHTFSNTKPINPTQGLFWVRTGLSSTLSFDRYTINGNGIDNVTPISGQLYLDNNWIDLNVKSFHNQSWHDWKTYLYKNGDECADITGGWNINGYTWSSDKGITVATKNTDHIHFIGAPQNAVALGMNNSIDVSNYSTLYIDSELVSQTNNCVLMLQLRSTKSGSSVLSYDFGSVITKSVHKIDITNITGNVYLLFGAHFSGLCQSKVYNVWLE